MTNAAEDLLLQVTLQDPAFGDWFPCHKDFDLKKNAPLPDRMPVLRSYETSWEFATNGKTYPTEASSPKGLPALWEKIRPYLEADYLSAAGTGSTAEDNELSEAITAVLEHS